MHKLKTKSGQVVEVNDDSYHFALSLGWTEVKEKPKAKPKAKATKGRTSGNGSNSNK